MQKLFNDKTPGQCRKHLRKRGLFLSVVLLLTFVNMISAQIISGSNYIDTKDPAYIFESDHSNNKILSTETNTAYQDNITITDGAFIYRLELGSINSLVSKEKEGVKTKGKTFNRWLVKKTIPKKMIPPQPPKQEVYSSHNRWFYTLSSEPIASAVTKNNDPQVLQAVICKEYHPNLFGQDDQPIQSFLAYPPKRIRTGGGIRPPPLLSTNRESTTLCGLSI